MKNNKKKIWETGINVEKDFWDRWFATKGLAWPNDYKLRFDSKREIRKELLPFIDQSKFNVKVIDVGAGPLTLLGTLLPNKRKVNLIAVDPLSKIYNELYKKYNVKPPIKTQFAEVETLSNQFKENFFDLVHMQNALDHSYNPLKGIEEMLYIVKKNHFIFLSHNINEAESEKYAGFHQWNLSEENGNFVIWNKSEKHNVNVFFAGKATITTIIDGNNISVIIKKL